MEEANIITEKKGTKYEFKTQKAEKTNERHLNESKVLLLLLPGFVLLDVPTLLFSKKLYFFRVLFLQLLFNSDMDLLFSVIGSQGV